MTQEQIAMFGGRNIQPKNVQEITIADPQMREVVTFTNSYAEDQWLDGEAHAVNTWSDGKITATGAEFPKSGN